MWTIKWLLDVKKNIDLIKKNGGGNNHICSMEVGTSFSVAKTCDRASIPLADLGDAAVGDGSLLLILLLVRKLRIW